jgi:hypothetical protein
MSPLLECESTGSVILGIDLGLRTVRNGQGFSLIVKGLRKFFKTTSNETQLRKGV